MPEDERPSEAPAPSLPSRAARRWRSRRAIVEDGSMRPTLEPGDRILVDPHAYLRVGPTRGDLVVLADPERPGRLIVKRIVGLPGDLDPRGEAVPPGTVAVLGDALASRDSRAFGPVPLRGVVGKVWFRYYPASRRQRFAP